MKLTCRPSTAVFWPRSSIRKAFVKLQAADFEAEYAASIGRAYQVASDNTLMIAPPPFLARIGANAWQTAIVPK